MNYKIFKSQFYGWQTVNRWAETEHKFIGVEIETDSFGRIIVKKEGRVIGIFSSEYSVIEIADK